MLRSGPSPPCRRCSQTCSLSGWTPSASVAARSSSSTSPTASRGSRPCTVTCTVAAPSPSMRRQTSGRSGVDRLLDGHALAAGRHEPVPDVADRSDERLVLDAELGTQPPDVDVDGPGAAEVVVAPDLLQQLRPGEDPPRVLGQELEELELLVREVQDPAPDPRRVRHLVDNDVAGADLRRRRLDRGLGE